VHPLEPGIGEPGEVGGVADQPLVGGRAWQADHDDRGPDRPADAVGGGERRDGIGYRVIEPELGQLPEGGEISEAEVVRQRRIHLVLRHDQALGQAAPQRRGRKVDELDLAGPHERIGHRLGSVRAGDPGDRLAQRVNVGDVEGRVDGDATGEQVVDILPALRVALTGEVRVGELIHQGQRRTPVQHRADVQLREAGVPVGDRTRRYHFEVAELGRGRRPAVPLPVRHDGIGAGALPGSSVPEHRVGLPDSGGNPEVGAQRAPAGW
jgi:hypothetical protein